MPLDRRVRVITKTIPSRPSSDELGIEDPVQTVSFDGEIWCNVEDEGTMVNILPSLTVGEHQTLELVIRALPADEFPDFLPDSKRTALVLDDGKMYFISQIDDAYSGEGRRRFQRLSIYRSDYTTDIDEWRGRNV